MAWLFRELFREELVIREEGVEVIFRGKDWGGYQDGSLIY
jgi:hypothetical protein